MLGTILGAAIGGGMGALNNYLAEEATSRGRKENYMYGEMAANNADSRTRALYHDFYSPQAILAQYNAAGLSPSLMFGHGPNPGGQSGAQGSGAAGNATPYMPISLLEHAQLANLAAQTEKTKAETENTQADTSKKKSEIGLIDTQKYFQDIQNEIAKETKDFQIRTVEENLNLLGNEADLKYWEAVDMETTVKFNKETYDQRVQTIKNQMENIYWDTMLKQAQKELTKEQINALKEQEKWIKQQISESVARIAQGWEHLALERQGQIITYRIARANLSYMIGKAKDERVMFQANLRQNKELGEKGISASYWKIGADVFNNSLNAASRFFGLWMFGSGKTETPADPGQAGQMPPIQYYQ